MNILHLREPHPPSLQYCAQYLIPFRRSELRRRMFNGTWCAILFWRPRPKDLATFGAPIRLTEGHPPPPNTTHFSTRPRQLKPPLPFSQTSNDTMKLSTVFAVALAAVACVLSTATAESQASIHLRIHSESAGAICYASCPSGQYCARGTTTCRAPNRKKDECFNPSTSAFQSGCDKGFKCKNGKCDYA